MSDNAGLGEIVVTAQRRSENLQKVPISVAVATAPQLEASAVSGIQSLKIVTPGLEVQSQNGYAIPIIRGVGSKAAAPGLEPPIAVYVDGVYYSAAPAAILDFNNIQQVEVLKGPQGTLFGRNATGGLIQIITREPKQEVGGQVNLSYGNYRTFKGDFYITGGISENVATDLAVSALTMADGYGTNFHNGKDVYRTNHDVNLRSKTVIGLGGATNARLILDYSDLESSQNANRITPGTTIPAPYGPAIGGDPWDVANDEQPLIDFRGGGASIKIDHDLGEVSLASITAYRKSKLYSQFDFDYTATRGRYVHLVQDDWQFSQELQASGGTGEAVKWLVGGYYFRANGSYLLDVFFEGVAAIPTAPPTVFSRTRSRQETDSISTYGQATIALSPTLNATGGLRFTTEKRTLADASTVTTRSSGSMVTTVPQFTSSKRFRKLTWRLAIDYEVDDDTLIYASYNRGFKSGGFNPGALAIGAFDPEVLDAYEVGLKTSFLERRVRANISAFYYDYKGVQIQRIVTGALGIFNAGKETIYGLDSELEARVSENLNLKVGYQYLPKARYDQFDNAVISRPRPAGGFTSSIGSVAGNRTLLSPRSSASVLATYTYQLASSEIILSGSYYYNSGYFQEPDNVARQRAYETVNASVKYQASDGLSASVWGRNLTNSAVANTEAIQSLGAASAQRVTYAPPRTYGITIGYRF